MLSSLLLVHLMLVYEAGGFWGYRCREPFAVAYRMDDGDHQRSGSSWNVQGTCMPL